MNKSGLCKKEFAWKVNGSLTTIRLVDDEVISLPQRRNLKTHARPSFPQGGKILDGKKPLNSQKSSSQPFPSPDDAAILDTTFSNNNTLAPHTSLYISTNEFSTECMFSAASYSSPRARSWSEASESDSSLSPIRQNLGQLELQSQIFTDEERHGQRRKIHRSSNQNSFRCSNSNDAPSMPFSLKESLMSVSSPGNVIDCISELPLQHLYQQSSPNSTVSIHKQNSFQFKFDYGNNKHLSTSSFSMPSCNRQPAASASQRYSNILSSSDELELDELDYASMWERDDEYLFSRDIPSCEANMNKKCNHVDSESVDCWSLVASREDDDCDREAGLEGWDSVRTSREGPLSECNDEYADEDDWSSGNDFINEDLWPDVNSMNSLGFDFEEDSLSLSRSFIDKEGGDLDDLCVTNESSSSIFAPASEDTRCANKSITESSPIDLKMFHKEHVERTSCLSTMSTSCARAISSCTLSKSDVKRLARAALLGETNDIVDHNSHCSTLNLSINQAVGSVSSPPKRNCVVDYRSKNSSLSLVSTTPTRENTSGQMKRFFSSDDSSAKGLSLSRTDITTQALSTETQSGVKNQAMPTGEGKSNAGNNRLCDKKDGISDGDDTDDDDDNSIFAYLSSHHHHNTSIH